MARDDDAGPTAPQRRRIRVTGRVQGVNYRAAARTEARRLGLTGFARNQPDGSVLIEIEGDGSAVARFVDWCDVGPPAASVARVDVEAVATTGETGFRTG